MNERFVCVRLPYKVDFVRKRHRTPDFASFWDDGVVLKDPHTCTFSRQRPTTLE
jgi:hypothetical protein